MRRFYQSALLLLVFSGCTNLDDAELTKRNSFVRLYESANSFVAGGLSITKDGGYLVGGTIHVAGDSIRSKMVIFKTDKFGQKEWETIINNGIVNAVKEIDTESGESVYYIVGDSVAYNPNSDQIPELQNYVSRLVVLDGSGEKTLDQVYGRKAANFHIDYHASAITLDDKGNIITLGTFKQPGNNEYAVVTAIKLSDYDTAWTQSFSYLNRDYSNTKSLFFDNIDDHVIWGTSVKETVGNFSKSYLAIPVINEQSTFLNNNAFGQNEDQIFMRIGDLQRIGTSSSFAAIGTHSEADGSNANMFFIKVNAQGNFIANSIVFFDHSNALQAIPFADRGLSSVQDTGDALVYTRDGGYVLAGSTINSSNGSRDIWLLKIGSAGTPLWSKTLGGKSNEIVSSIQEAADGSLVIYGTIQDGNSDAGGISSIFIIRTDSKGNLTN
jgi:hypothetical protein